VLPNVNIGNNVIIGAGSVVTNDIPNNSLAVGNPARVIGNTQEYINKQKELMDNTVVYDESWTLGGQIANDQKEQMKIELKDRMGFVK
jgi:maltose O-acetyltransferase